MVLHLWGFSVLLIEAVASGQLAWIFLSGVTDLWAVWQICMVFGFGKVIGKPDVMLRDFSLVVDLIIFVYILIKEIAG